MQLANVVFGEVRAYESTHLKEVVERDVVKAIACSHKLERRSLHLFMRLTRHRVASDNWILR